MSDNRDDQDYPSNDSSFGDRLRSARSRQGLDKPPPGETTQTGTSQFGTSAIGAGLRVGVELLSALVVGLGIGWALDWWLHTRPLFIIVFVLLGGAAGMLNVWRVVAPKPPGSGR